MTEQVSIAIELPVAMAPMINKVVGELAGSAEAEVKAPEESGKAANDLGFEPLTVGAVGWFLLKIGGEAAIAITGAVIGELIHKEMQTRAEIKRKTVRVRFPDGTLYLLTVDNPQSMAELQQVIAQKTRP